MRRTLSAFALATTCAVLTACGGSIVDDVTSPQATAPRAPDAGDIAEPSIAEAPTPYTPKSTFDGLDSSGLKSVAAINWPQQIGEYTPYTDMELPVVDFAYEPTDAELLSDLIRITVWEGDGADDPTIDIYFGSAEVHDNVACEQSTVHDFTADCAIVMSDGWLQVQSLPYSGDLSFAFTWSNQLYNAL